MRSAIALTAALLLSAFGCSRSFDNAGPLSLTECNRSSDCPPGERCGLAGRCTEPCAEDRDCFDIDPRYVCIESFCGEQDEKSDPLSLRRCQLNSDCPEAEICGALGFCTVECREDRDCPDAEPAYRCVEKHCGRGDGSPVTPDPSDDPIPTPPTSDDPTPNVSMPPSPGPTPDTTPEPPPEITALTVVDPPAAGLRMNHWIEIAVAAGRGGDVTFSAAGEGLAGESEHLSSSLVRWRPTNPSKLFEEQEIQVAVTATNGRGQGDTKSVAIRVLGNAIALSGVRGGLASYSSDGSFLGTIVPPGQGRAAGFARRPDNGNILVVYEDDMVREYTELGRVATSWAVDVPGFELAGDLHIADDRVIITDKITGRLHFFSLDGDFAFSETPPELNSSRPERIITLRTGPDAGKLLVVYTLQGSLQIFSTRGVHELTMLRGLGSPFGVVELPSQELLVFENSTNVWRGKVYDFGGNLQREVLHQPANTTVPAAVMVGDWIVYVREGQPRLWASDLEGNGFDFLPEGQDFDSISGDYGDLLYLGPRAP